MRLRGGRLRPALKALRRRPMSRKARLFRPKGFRKFRRGIDRTGGFFGRFAKGGELKFHDVDLDDALIDSGGTITPSIALIPQGVTEITRVGRRCTIRSINWRFHLIGATDANTAGPPPEVVRILMYIDKQANGATAAVTDILESADFQSFNNLANKSRFRTLMDRTYAMNYLASTGADATAEWKLEDIEDSFFKKVNLPMEFDSTTGAITEIKSNNIGVLLISRDGTNVGFGSKIRLRFSDN